jgi:hypothetical protein
MVNATIRTCLLKCKKIPDLLNHTKKLLITTRILTDTTCFFLREIEANLAWT